MLTHPVMNLFLLAILVAPAISSAVPRVCERDQDITLASFNLESDSWFHFPRFWLMRKDALITSIRELEADLISLQEANRDQADTINSALAQHDLAQGGRHTQLFYRQEHWQLKTSQLLIDEADLELQNIELAPRDPTRSKTVRIWNIWSRTSAQQDSELVARLLQVLAKAEGPDWITLSFKADDHLKHDRHLWSRFLGDSRMQQADPKTLAITSNGWWAIRWTTQSWHDAIFADITWRFKEAKLVRRKFGGSYPSTHFPLLATYCAQSETLLTTGNHSGF
jgi:hypothetical protein